MVEYVSGGEWSEVYGLKNLFMKKRTYCSADSPEIEILLKLSTKNHLQKNDEEWNSNTTRHFEV